jgi:hypothetical protein
MSQVFEDNNQLAQIVQLMGTLWLGQWFQTKMRRSRMVLDDLAYRLLIVQVESRNTKLFS